MSPICHKILHRVNSNSFKSPASMESGGGGLERGQHRVGQACRGGPASQVGGGAGVDYPHLDSSPRVGDKVDSALIQEDT